MDFVDTCTDVLQNERECGVTQNVTASPGLCYAEHPANVGARHSQAIIIYGNPLADAFPTLGDRKLHYD